MKQQQLKIGDLVEPLSGSLPQRVTAIDGEMVEVLWVDPEDSRHYTATLPMACLRRVEET